MSACSTCGGEVRWVVVQASGKRMPLDPTPSSKGNVHITAEGQGEVLGATSAVDAIEAGTPLYQSHFVTCPQAAQHRRSAR